MVCAALEKVKVKKPDPLYEEIHFNTLHDGTCIEMLHVGTYDTEPLSFEQMDRFAAENNLQRISKWHREIYLNNAKRTNADKLKTILRYRVKERNEECAARDQKGDAPIGSALFGQL